MISIVDCGKPKTSKQKGTRVYEVRIGKKTLFAFEHNRDEKLSVCLAKAANAAAQYERLKEIMGNS